MVHFVACFHIWTHTPFPIHRCSCHVNANQVAQKQQSIPCFLNFIKLWDLKIMPVIAMSDHDQGQLNAIKVVYSESGILLCWWHVLHAMQLHCCWMKEFPKLWECVYEWVKTPDLSKFDSWWNEIASQSCSSPEFHRLSQGALCPSGQDQHGNITQSSRRVMQIWLSKWKHPYQARNQSDLSNWLFL